MDPAIYAAKRQKALEKVKRVLDHPEPSPDQLRYAEGLVYAEMLADLAEQVMARIDALEARLSAVEKKVSSKP